MHYTSQEAHDVRAIFMPVAEFAQDEEGFLYRVNPYLPHQVHSMEEFAEVVEGEYYAPEDLDRIILEGENLDVSLGVVVNKADDGGWNIHNVPQWEELLEDALDADPWEYTGDATIIFAEETHSTSYYF